MCSRASQCSASGCSCATAHSSQGRASSGRYWLRKNIARSFCAPQYKDYTSKAKLGNAPTAADSVKTAVALCIQENDAATDCIGGKMVLPPT